MSPRHQQRDPEPDNQTPFWYVVRWGDATLHLAPILLARRVLAAAQGRPYKPTHTQFPHASSSVLEVLGLYRVEKKYPRIEAVWRVERGHCEVLWDWGIGRHATRVDGPLLRRPQRVLPTVAGKSKTPGASRWYAQRYGERQWSPVSADAAQKIMRWKAGDPALVDGRDYQALATLRRGVSYEHSDPQDFVMRWTLEAGRVPSARLGAARRGKPKRNALLKRHESHPAFWGHKQTGTVQRQTWLDDVGARVERWAAVTLEGKTVERFPGEPHATAYDQTFWSRVDAAQALSNAASASTSGIGRELTPGELRNQRKAIAQDAERALKARDRADLAALRARVKQAFEGKRSARKAASALCAVVKARAKTTCITSRASAKAHGDELVAKAKRALKKERAHQAEIRRLTRKAPKSRKAAAAARSSAKAESDSAVLANIDAALVPVWHKVKSRIKATSRMSRTEAFEQWVHDHSAQVAEIQAAAHERLDERELEESERAYFEQQSAAGDAPLPPLTKQERAELIRRLFQAHKPAHRTRPGERMHPGVLMLDTNGTSVLAPLEHMADVQLRELAHRFRRTPHA